MTQVALYLQQHGVKCHLKNLTLGFVYLAPKIAREVLLVIGNLINIVK